MNCINHPDRPHEALGFCVSCYRKHLRKNGPCRSRQRRQIFNESVGLNKNYWGHIRAKYSLSSDEYIDMYETQNGKCACCNTATRLVVDHDHQTNKVRKLLCSRCNTIAGAIEDIKYLAVLKYLEEHGSE